MYIKLVEEGNIGEPIRKSQSQSGQGKKKNVGEMDVALGGVEYNGPFIVSSGTELGAVKHETITNGITPC
jgi:hypothetical protein